MHFRLLNDVHMEVYKTLFYTNLVHYMYDYFFHCTKGQVSARLRFLKLSLQLIGKTHRKLHERLLRSFFHISQMQVLSTLCRVCVWFSKALILKWCYEFRYSTSQLICRFLWIILRIFDRILLLGAHFRFCGSYEEMMAGFTLRIFLKLWCW